MAKEQSIVSPSIAVTSWTIQPILSIGAGVLLLAASAQVRIPLPFTPVPVTLQTAVVFLCGALLGWRGGVAATLAYLALGATGAPVFAGGAAGGAILTGATAGYLYGFVAAAAFLGALRIVGRPWPVILASLIVAEAIIHAMGVLGLSMVTQTSLKTAFIQGSLPFLPGAVAKIGLIATLLHHYGSPLASLAQGQQPENLPENVRG